MSVDSTALEEYDYYEDVEPIRWNNLKYKNIIIKIIL